MQNFKKITLTGLGIVLLFSLVGCAKAADVSATAEQQPTIDIALLHTQVAQTVIANITVEAALHPSVTPTVVVVNTEQPTETPPAIITIVPAVEIPATATKQPVSASSGG